MPTLIIYIFLHVYLNFSCAHNFFHILGIQIYQCFHEHFLCADSDFSCLNFLSQILHWNGESSTLKMVLVGMFGKNVLISFCTDSFS